MQPNEHVAALALALDVEHIARLCPGDDDASFGVGTSYFHSVGLSHYERPASTAR